MKIKIENLKDLIECPHCFCIEHSVQTGNKTVEIKNSKGEVQDGLVSFTPIYTSHLKCCNCGKTKKK